MQTQTDILCREEYSLEATKLLMDTIYDALSKPPRESEVNHEQMGTEQGVSVLQSDS